MEARRDLIFPHHESEIALMEAAYEKPPFVKIWVHTGFLNVRGEKMAKSAGNFITIEEILKKILRANLRLFFITRHYRSPIDYSEKALKEAQKLETKISEFANRIEQESKGARNKNARAQKEIQETIDKFWKFLEDDFNTPDAFASFFELLSHSNKLADKKELGKDLALAISKFLRETNNIFQIYKKEKEDIPEEIINLAQKRTRARKEKNWEQADIIRNQINKEGYDIKDLEENKFQIKKLK